MNAKFSRMLRAVALLALPLMAVAVLRGQNLILNAGFESPQLPSPDPVDAWTLTGSGMIVQNSADPRWLPAQLGTQQFYLEENSSISQPVTLTGGEEYHFTFYLSPLQTGLNANTAQIIATFSLGGESHQATFSATTSGSWFFQEWSFTPVSSGEFTLVMASPNGAFSNLDDVSMTAVPEPSTYAVGAGVAALVVAIWRRRARAQGRTS